MIILWHQGAIYPFPLMQINHIDHINWLHNELDIHARECFLYISLRAAFFFFIHSQILFDLIYLSIYLSIYMYNEHSAKLQQATSVSGKNIMTQFEDNK